MGGTYPNRIAGLVYLDALADPTLDYSEYEALRKKLPDAIRYPPSPSAADYKSFQAFRDWQLRTSGVPFPESELRNDFNSNPGGSVGTYKTAQRIRDAIIAGAQTPDYAHVPVPVLAFITYPPSVEDQLKRYHIQGDRERKAVEDVYAADFDWAKRRMRNLQSGVPRARVIELPGANHYVFLSNEADVLRELRVFLATF